MRTKIVDGKDITPKTLRPKDYMQCGGSYSGPRSSRGISTRFCTRNHGHEGDHRGDRVQWNQRGRKVKVTLPLDAV
jgi:hypothetical protein